jgi:hypothetical protein
LLFNLAHDRKKQDFKAFQKEFANLYAKQFLSFRVKAARRGTGYVGDWDDNADDDADYDE